MMWTQIDFCSGDIYIILSSGKKVFAHVGFCAPEMLTKFWDFAAGMDFDTK